jgi:hypothetical protein
MTCALDARRYASDEQFSYAAGGGIGGFSLGLERTGGL